jgi:hypothetical protein
LSCVKLLKGVFQPERCERFNEQSADSIAVAVLLQPAIIVLTRRDRSILAPMLNMVLDGLRPEVLKLHAAE